MRTEEVYRKTKETEVKVKVNLDGEGKATVNSGVPFLDHMLTSLATHSLIDINRFGQRRFSAPHGRRLSHRLGRSIKQSFRHTGRHNTFWQRRRTHGLLFSICRR